jgi:hypothetical protein
MISLRSRLAPAAFALALASVAPLAASAAEATAGRTLVNRYADAIIGVELVVMTKVKFGDREQPPREQRIEMNGTVISPSGLTVTSLAAVDPQAQYDAMRASQQGGRGPELVGVDFKEVKLRLADGKEVPARFVLKDADLDLAFMAPETAEPGREYPHVKLEEVAEGAMLADYYLISRAAKSLQRVPLVRRTEVMGIVEKPRRIFILTEQRVAAPVFDLQGKILGISLYHFANGQSSVIVMPSADIADMAKQAVAAQAKKE